MIALKKSLLMLSILVTLIIIIDYNVQGLIILPGGQRNDDNDLNTTTSSSTITDLKTTNSLKVSHSYSASSTSSVSKQKYSPLNDNTFINIIHMLRFSLNPKLLVKEYNTSLRGKASWLTCQICSATIGLIRLYPSLSTVQTIFNNVCSLGYEEYRVCDGLSQLFGDELIQILIHSSLSHSEICGLVIGTSCMPTNSKYPYDNKWKLKLLPLSNNVANVLLDLEHRNKLREKNDDLLLTTKQQQNISTILHLSDLHLDIYYQTNSPAGCNEPLCCRQTSTANKRSHPAGYWGSMDNCDSVLRTIENLLITISKNHSDHYKYLLLTGDYIPHDIWNTTKEEIIQTTRIFNNLIKKHVPTDKIIIPVIGNHESHPVDQFCIDDLNKKYSSVWLYEELLQQWKQWIPKEYHETFRQYGYYSIIDNNLRFIVLNTNYCARLNFWNLLRYLDMGHMLHWLQLELQNATISNQNVYIVGHIAPDEDECYTHWVITYRSIIEIYKNIIRGQFFGHTHLDEIRLYYSNNNNNENNDDDINDEFSFKPKPISVAYLAPSVTTYLNVMPSFRFYSTDPLDGEIIDHMTYYLNLTKANYDNNDENNVPVWNFEYNARDSYNMTSLSPKSWHKFCEKTITNPQYLRKYYKHYGRYNDEKIDTVTISTMINVIDKIFVRV